jgi:guanine deaminase
MKNSQNIKNVPIALAVDLARVNLNSADGGPFGAVVVKDGLVVGRGRNEVILRNDPTAHAEVLAIREACRNLDTFSLQGAVLYASCEPCPMCLAAAYWARVDEIVYAAGREDAARIGFDDAHIYREICLPPDQRHLPMRQHGREEAVTVMDAWSRKMDKVLY